jgi:hypothetical protein
LRGLRPNNECEMMCREICNPLGLINMYSKKSEELFRNPNREDFTRISLEF